MNKADIIARVIRPQIRDIVGEVIRDITDNFVHLSKAILVFNSILMPNIIKWVTEEGITLYFAEEIYKDVLNVAAKEEMAVMTQDDIDREQERIAMAE